MNTPTQTICIRCGKVRIVSRTWKDTIQTLDGTTEVIRTSTVCPDEECQKKVDEKLSADREKYLSHQRK